MELKEEKAYLSLPAHSRVWIYQSKRELSDEEVTSIYGEGQDFIAGWAAHGAQLKAAFYLFHHRFLVLFADESSVSASGCSIDSSVHWVKSVEAKYQLDLFDRMQVAFRKELGAPVELVHLNELADFHRAGKITDDSIVFDNMVATLGDFQSKWEVPLKTSWHYQRLV
jgi:hypothetical protein